MGGRGAGEPSRLPSVPRHDDQAGCGGLDGPGAGGGEAVLPTRAPGRAISRHPALEGTWAGRGRVVIHKLPH